MKGVAILGSTGSVGASTLDVISRHREALKVVALTARSNDARLFEQCIAHRPEVVALEDRTAATRLAERLKAAGIATQVLRGAGALEEVARLPQADMVMAAIVGAAGLLPTLAAAQAGKRLLLANKEALVMSGSLLIEAVRASGAELIPIDSEHNAIFQCLPHTSVAGRKPAGLRRILLTASGGPFLGTPAEKLCSVTPAEACAHPNWDMGRKISVDSATLMNKGLELIEACWLFGVTPDDVQVVVHPQSVVHSMVEYVDGSVLAQLGNPDMRTPISHALSWPERWESGVESLDIVGLGRLTFQEPDLARFPCLRLAQQAARAGGTLPAILNAANEAAVESFLSGHLNFTSIPVVIEGVLNCVGAMPVRNLESVLAADHAARQAAAKLISRLEGATPDPVAGALA
ncbi:MAG TPA: 1-deoxy-D-xylulose-5-phosphate reductoisomerase [Steroidobacteraceae bacterium]|nr:1-deoxy-D-xylulose-5-phosphate reductoisomerase [Steroidobacteraceae bacterium]